MDIGQSGRERAIDVDRDRPDAMHGEEFLEAVDHPLGASQAERGDHDLASEPGGTRHDGVKLLDQGVIGLKFTIAVSGFRDEDIDILHHGRIGEEPHVSAAEVAGEDESAVLAVLAVVDLNERGAKDMPGVVIGEGDSR